jgi:hypothetical protein
MSAKTFTFEVDGKKYTIPAYKKIPMRALELALDEENQVKQALIILNETVKDKKTLDTIKDMSVDDFVLFVEAWGGDSELSLGD